MDSTVFVKACVPGLKGKKPSAEDLTEMYLFVELVTAVRVAPVSGIASRKKGGRRKGGGGDASPVRRSRDRDNNASELDESYDAEQEPEDDEEVALGEAGVGAPVVEMCSGWCLVPLAGGKDGRASHNIEMHGGTPFLPHAVESADVRKRTGVLNVMANTIGMKVKSKLEVAVDATPRRALHKDTFALSPDLPVNVVLPKSGVIAVALFRRLLLDQQCVSSTYASGRMLPQTGALLSVDPLFGIFPRILADEAARGAFLSLWAKKCPLEAINAKNRPLPSAVKALRNITMHIYRAMAQPAASKPMLKLVETADDVELRREAIIDAVVGAGVADDPQHKFGSGTFSKSSFGFGMGPADEEAAAAADENSEKGAPLFNIEINTPFNPRELVWDRHRE